VTTGLLPGSPEHDERMSDEAIEAGLAETPVQRMLSLFKAADARLEELRAAIVRHDDELADELAEAYLLILKEGVVPILADREESEEDVAAAKRLAYARVLGEQDVLVELARLAPKTLKARIQEALAACREQATR
jgi:hypothetical protein